MSVIPPTVRDGSSSLRIAESIRSGILRGQFPPGTRLRQEDVAAQFGASRLPVREALRILESDGLVTLVPNAGARVSQLTLPECEEMYQMRERVEPLLLRFSAPHLGEEALGELAEMAQAMERREGVEAFLRIDREFHLLSYSAATTIMLGDTVERLWNTTQHYRRAFTLLLDPESSRIVHDEHHMLVNALKGGDVDDAERVLAGHIRRTRTQLQRHPDIFESTLVTGPS